MKTLNTLIAELIAVRDANPALGDLPIQMEDQELGTMYPQDIKGVEIETNGTLLAVR